MTTYLRVNYNKDTWVTREATEPEWDRDDTDTSWSFEHVEIVKEKDSWDLAVPFDVEAGDTVYVVAAIYSTGDSFGHDDRDCCEYVDVFLDEAKAQACINAVDAARKSRSDNTEKGLTWIREDGSEGKLDYVPWNGYFECLDEVRCETLEVKEK